MQMCNYKVGDLLSLENRQGKIELWIVVEQLFGCTIKVRNIVSGRIHRMPPRWFTKL